MIKRSRAGFRLKLPIAVPLLYIVPFVCVCLCTCQGSYDAPSSGDFEVFLSQGDNRKQFGRFQKYLKQNGVFGVVEARQLLCQGTDWSKVQQPAFAFPPRQLWANILPTLRLLRDEVVPVTGRLKVLSGYRTNKYNRLAGGAPGSRHLYFQAVDVIPPGYWLRYRLHGKFLEIWRKRGKRNRFGLGLYSGTRFHVDTYRYRRW